MFIHRIDSKVLRDEGHKFESVDLDAAERKLAEVQKRDPRAVLVSTKGR
jgi:hypothetical protein